MRYFAINHSNSAKSLKTLLHYTRTCIPWKSAMESWFLFMFELLLEAPLLTTVQARLRLTLISPQTKSYDCNNFNSYLFLPKFYVCFSWMRSLEISKDFYCILQFCSYCAFTYSDWTDLLRSECQESGRNPIAINTFRGESQVYPLPSFLKSVDRTFDPWPSKPMKLLE